jgi:hypothetical protein
VSLNKRNLPLRELDIPERELILKAPILVCILIAGADGSIDRKEVREAIDMSRNKHWVKSNIQPFFEELAEDFEDKLKILLQGYPFDSKSRNDIIQRELTTLNEVLAKTERNFARSYYDMLRSLAQRIAASSGSIWGRITAEEARLLELPMIRKPD